MHPSSSSFYWILSITTASTNVKDPRYTARHKTLRPLQTKPYYSQATPSKQVDIVKMSSTIRTILFLFVAQLLVTVCLAVEYQVPGVFKNITVDQPSKACSDSTFDVIGGAEILTEDCGE